MDVMMGRINRATIKSLRKLPLKHKCAILCVNMAETSLLMGDVLRVVVQTDDQRCRKIDRSMRRADVEMVMEENHTLEKKNGELKSDLEGEKGKVQTLEDKVKELQTALKKEKEVREKKENELVASYKKYHELLRKKMDIDTSLNARKEENEKL
ncbi:hypothetical protein Dimus_035797 [Dionaea muscipula]